DLLFALGLKHRLYGRQSVVRPGTITGYARALQRRGTIEALARQVRCWRSDFESLRSDLPNLKHPVLLVWGSEDRIVRLSTVEAVRAQLPQAELALIRGAGHVPYEEQPEEFVRIVKAWLLARA